MDRFLKLLSVCQNITSSKIDKWWSGYIVSLLGFAMTIAAFYPGYMSPDSVANLTQGRNSQYYDINSPIMSCLWGFLDGLVEGPSLMLILHNLIFWCGCAIFWQATKIKSAKLGISLVLLGFMPQFLSQLSTIWKDVGLAVSLFFVSSILYYSTQKTSKTLLAVTPLFLFYAFGMRLNAFPAIIPFVVWSGIIVCGYFNFVFSSRQKAVFVAVFSGIYFAVLSLSVNFVNSRLTEEQTVYPFQQVFLYDLAAISIGRNETVFPDYILRQENFSLDKVKSEYDVRSVNKLIYGDSPVLKLSSDPYEIAALQSKWIESISDNKALYFTHRFRVFAQLLGFTRQTVTMPFWDKGFSENPQEFTREPNILNQALTKYFSLLRKWGPFHGFIWMSLCLICFYKSIRNRFEGDWRIVFFLSLSALLYTAAYFPTTPSTEFRYILWSELAATVAIVFTSYLSIKQRGIKNASVQSKTFSL